jgi:hypothetical protein
LSETLDLTGMVEKRRGKKSMWYEDYSGEIIAKRCTTCSEIKSIDGFTKGKTGIGGRRAYCKECEAIVKISYYSINHEGIKEYQKSYYRKNKGKVLKYKRTNQIYNPEYWQQYYKKNRNNILEANRIRRKNNPERDRNIVHRRRARKYDLPNDFNVDDVRVTLRYFEYNCALTGDSNNRTWDHAIPIAVGHGGTTYGNMYPLRGDLNSSKGDRNIFEWFKANRQRFNLSQAKFDALIDWLAEANDMTVEGYTAYVYECHSENLKEAK